VSRFVIPISKVLSEDYGEALGIRIIEGRYGNPTCARKYFSCPCHGRSTGWAEFGFSPAVTFVRAIFVSFKYTAGDLNDRFAKVG